MAEDKSTAQSAEPTVEDLDEFAEVLPAAFEITSYGADFPVDGLVKRLDQGDIVVPLFSMLPEEGISTVGFQRQYVWSKVQADRFVESLLLGLPVPGIFLVREPDNRFLVLDGQQRLRTLERFYAGTIFGKEFALQNVQDRLQGLTYKSLESDDRRRLDNSIIHATVVRQEEPSEDQSSIYLIFERLNSGGTMLQPQEIRVALFHGAFSKTLSKLNSTEGWRRLYGKPSARLKDLELILRFLALYHYRHQYRRPMKGFLNRYMAANRNLELQSEAELEGLFASTVNAIVEGIGSNAFKPYGPVNAAVLDSVMVGVASAHRDDIDPRKLRGAYEKLLEDTLYLSAIERSTADEESVKKRLERSVTIFSET